MFIKGWGSDIWYWPNVPKDVWGRQSWEWLHRRALQYRAADAEQTRYDIENFLSHLPCPECKLHAVAYYQAHPPDMRNSESLQYWVYNFHNAVNVRLGKPYFTYLNYLKKYEKEIKKN